MPTAKKLPSGSWRVRVFSHYEYDGDKKKPVYESFTSKDPTKEGKKEAERMAAEWQYKRQNRESLLTVRDAIRQYIDIKESVLSPSTIRGYEICLRNNYKTIEQLRVRDLTQKDVQTWISGIATTLSSKTVRNVYALFTASIDLAQPGTQFTVTLPAKEKTALYTPNDADIKVLMSSIKGTDMEIAVMLSAFCSLRRGEICAVTSEDIHGTKLRINKCMVEDKYRASITKCPKTYDSDRYVDLPPFVLDRISSIEGRLYPHYPHNLTNYFARVLKRCGLPHFRFHDLRHYYVSISHALGVPDAYIMESGGWKTSNVMNRVYRDTLSDFRKQEADILSSHFSDLLA